MSGEEEKKTDKALKDDYDGDTAKMIEDLEKEKDSIGFLIGHLKLILASFHFILI